MRLPRNCDCAFFGKLVRCRLRYDVESCVSMRLAITMFVVMIWVVSQSVMAYAHASSITSQQHDGGMNGGILGLASPHECALQVVGGSHHDHQHEPGHEHENTHQMASCCGSACSSIEAVLASHSRPTLQSHLLFRFLATIPVATSIDLTKPPPENSV